MEDSITDLRAAYERDIATTTQLLLKMNDEMEQRAEAAEAALAQANAALRDIDIYDRRWWRKKYAEALRRARGE